MKIPEHAKLVFKGVIFDVYQWEQEMYDGSHATFEMLKRPDTILILPTMGDKIILSHQEQPSKPAFDSFLGGRAEEGEDSLESAKRELLEEGGLVSDNWELIKTYEPFSKFEWKIYLYVARDCKKIAEQHLDPGEKITLYEASFEEFVKKISNESFWGGEITLDILLMEKRGELEEFRKKIFG